MFKNSGLAARQHAFLILDIDTYGHAFDDCVITEFVRTFKTKFRQTDIIGHTGGDEFVIFITNVPGEDGVCREAQTLVENLHRNVTQEEHTCRISTSIGIAIYPQHGRIFQSLYKKADAALYQTKARGRNGYTLYAESLAPLPE